MWGKVTGVSFVAFTLVLVVECYYLEDNNPKYVTAAVGDFIVLNCEVDFPQNFPIPYMVLWRRKVSILIKILFTSGFRFKNMYLNAK